MKGTFERYALQFTKSNQEEWGMILAAPGRQGNLEWILSSARVNCIQGHEQPVSFPSPSRIRATYQFLMSDVRESAKSDGTSWSRITTNYTVPGPDELPDLNKVHIEVNIGVEGFRIPT